MKIEVHEIGEITGIEGRSGHISECESHVRLVSDAAMFPNVAHLSDILILLAAIFNIVPCLEKPEVPRDCHVLDLEMELVVDMAQS